MFFIINMGIIIHLLPKQRKTLHTISETPVFPPKKSIHKMFSWPPKISNL